MKSQQNLFDGHGLNRTVLGVLLCASILLPQSEAFAVKPEQQSPPFTLRTVDGKAVNLSDFHGKVVYLDFWASWCGPCRHTLPWMNTLQEKYAKRGLTVLAVNVDREQKDAARALAEFTPSYPVVFDPEGSVASAYELPTMPTSFVIGRDGRVVSVHSGFREGDEYQVEAELQGLLGSQS